MRLYTRRRDQFAGSPRVFMVRPPPTEACCLTIAQNPETFGCLNLVPHQCSQFGGVSLGPGTFCEPKDGDSSDQCGPPVIGRCCLDAGGCVVTDQFACQPPDQFTAGEDCSGVPSPCLAFCWFRGAECCGNIAPEVAITCAQALDITSNLGTPIWYVNFKSTCYLFDTENAGSVLEELDDETVIQIPDTGNPTFPDCPSCCNVLGTPCPPAIPDYCTNCAVAQIGTNAFEWTVTGCGVGGNQFPGYLIEIPCIEDSQSWAGVLPSGGGPGPPMNGPDGQFIDMHVEISCDGIIYVPPDPILPDRWVIRFFTQGESCNAIPWTLDIRLSAPRTTDFPSVLYNVDEVLFNNSTANVESYAIDLGVPPSGGVNSVCVGAASGPPSGPPSGSDDPDEPMGPPSPDPFGPPPWWHAPDPPPFRPPAPPPFDPCDVNPCFYGANRWFECRAAGHTCTTCLNEALIKCVIKALECGWNDNLLFHCQDCVWDRFDFDPLCEEEDPPPQFAILR